MPPATKNKTMRREFLLNLILLVTINLLVKPLYIFGVELQVQNQLGNAQYGLYFTLWNFSFLFQIVGDLGLQQYSNRVMAQSPQLFAKYFRHFLVLKGLLALGLLCLGALTAWLIGFRGEELWLCLVLLLCNQVLITALLFLRANLGALQRYRTDSLLSSLDKLLLLIFGGLLIYSEQLTLLRFILSQTLAYGLTAALAFGLLWPHWRRGKGALVDLRILRFLLQQSAPYALVVLLMSLYTRLDGVLLERLLGSQGQIEAGMYAFGYRWLDALNMLGYLFAGLLLPMFSKLLWEQDKGPLHQLVELSIRLMLALTLVASLGLAYYAEPLSRSMLDDFRPEVLHIMRWLMPIFNAGGLIYIFGTLLVANGNLRSLNTLFAFVIVFNLIGNLYYIPAQGAIGAAKIAFFSQSLIALVEGYWVYRFLGFRPQKAFWRQGLGLLASLLTALFLVEYLGSDWPWFYRLLGFGLLSGLGSLACGWLDWRTAWKLRKSKG